MGVIVAASTLHGAVTPICNDCGIALCWDISDEEYAEQTEFWDAWICKDCNGGKPFRPQKKRDKPVNLIEREGIMSNSNMRHWDRISKPPTNVMKPIQAGRLKGKSDISPQWRMQAMTELFGPCGFGWKYTIDKLWLEKGEHVAKEKGAGFEIAAFAIVSLYYKEGDQWSEAIPGIGGNMFVEIEKNGPHNSDEAFKMAVTDALSVAMKSIGMAAEVYLGNFDGSKYTGQAQRLPEAPTPPDPKDAEHIERVKKALHTLYGADKKAALDKVEELTSFIPKGKTEADRVKGVRDFTKLTGQRLTILMANLEKLVPKEEPPA